MHNLSQKVGINVIPPIISDKQVESISKIFESDNDDGYENMNLKREINEENSLRDEFEISNGQKLEVMLPVNDNQENKDLKTSFEHTSEDNHGCELELVWKNINLKSKPVKSFKKKNRKPEKVILQNLNGAVKTGECLAIIGSSGAGKTTLLNYLSRKIGQKNLKFEGDVFLNNNKISDKKFNQISAYVMQDDILESVMTPKEIFMFTAKLKYNIQREDIEKKVSKMINNLHLKYCQNTRVGDEIHRGISGGERKRTSIGVELISDPQIIFLDEPTTGLDSYNAFEIVLLLKNLAKQGKMIILTIHQPSTQIFEMINKVCILAQGMNVYLGPQHSSFTCFEYFGLPVPDKYNPFEHYIEITSMSSVSDESILSKFPQLKEIKNHVERYDAYIEILSSIYEEQFAPSFRDGTRIKGFTQENLELFKNKEVHHNYFYETLILFEKNILVALRSKKVFFMKITQTIFIGVLIALVYYNLTKEFSGIQDRIGVIFILTTLIIMGGSNLNVLTFSSERKVFLRDRSNNLYSMFSYFIARFLREIPVGLISMMIVTIILYWPLQLNYTYTYNIYIMGKLPIIVVGVLFLCHMSGASYAFFLGSFASNPEFLLNINTAFNIPMILLSGFFANSDNYAPYLIPLEYISAYKYAFQTLIQVEFRDMQPLYGFNINPAIFSPMATRFIFSPSFGISILCLILIIISFSFIGFIFLYFFAKIKV